MISSKQRNHNTQEHTHTKRGTPRIHTKKRRVRSDPYHHRESIQYAVSGMNRYTIHNTIYQILIRREDSVHSDRTTVNASAILSALQCRP